MLEIVYHLRKYERSSSVVLLLKIHTESNHKYETNPNKEHSTKLAWNLQPGHESSGKAKEF